MQKQRSAKSKKDEKNAQKNQKDIDAQIKEIEMKFEVANPYLDDAKKALNLKLSDFSVSDKKRAD